MQESKHTRLNDEVESHSESNSSDREDIAQDDKAVGSDGWYKYRKWVSTRRHGNIDRSLYSWKGYRSWSEQIKRNWPDS